MSIQPGTDIGRYHILEQLGEGGMALVFKAYDTRLETEVALKVIRVGDITPNALPRILKRFQIEAKKMAQLTHPNIMRIIDYGEHEDTPYLVMPYLPGGTLKSKLGKPMGWREAVQLLAPIADALAYAHDKGLIHRDVKPSNILITEKGQPMLSDFGVAKVLESEETLDLTGTGMGVGTPEYMAPEQGEGRTIDQRADIYSLGIVMYELVTGRKPFQADTPMAVIIKQATQPLPKPSEFNPDVPAEIERLLFKALAKDPKDRFTDMSSFARSMRQMETQKLVGAANVEPAEKPGRQTSEEPRKKPLQKLWLFGLLGAAGLLLLGYAGVKAAENARVEMIEKQTLADAAATESAITPTPEVTDTIAPAIQNESNTITQEALLASSTANDTEATRDIFSEDLKPIWDNSAQINLDSNVRSFDIVTDHRNGEADCKIIHNDIENFILRAEFSNPDYGLFWLYSIIFRYKDNSGSYMMHFYDSALYTLVSNYEVLQGGLIDNMTEENNAPNLIELIVNDNEGFIMVNRSIIDQLDLSTTKGSGSLAICSNVLKDYGENGTVIKVDKVQLWQIP